MNVVITGGTGSLGRALTRRFLGLGAERVVVLSRDEFKQAEMAAEFGQHPSLRFFLGDVRDRARLVEAFHGVDTVIHCAALKRVDAVAYTSSEMRKTNIEGSANVTSAALECGVRRVLMISSDKACAPANHYGTTKAAMEAEATAYNALSVPRGTRIACTRWGNVLGSRGSVVHIFRQAVAAGRPIPLTDPEMTRFWLTLDEAVGHVLTALEVMRGGEVFVPVLPAMKLVDLAEAIAPANYPAVVTGLRPGGEKLAEVLITEEEARRTVEVADGFWAVTPHLHPWTAGGWLGPAFPAGFTYASDRVAWRLSVDEMRKMLEGVPE